MIERVIENWLTKVNERSLEIPFCQLLAGEGYQVVHLSRHGPAEQGKDILAIAPDGTPCAFQLKGAPGGKITQKAWEEYVPQATRLVELPIIHPSIDRELPGRVYFVTNGELDEEVRREIEDRNSEWERRGYPRLGTVVKGQLLARFRELHTNFWPVQLTFEKALLELFLADGSDCVDKDKLSGFVATLLPLSDRPVNKAECGRSLASAAILTAYALSPYNERANHIALIEGWTVYIACLAAVVEKHGLDEAYWHESLSIAKQAIERAFVDLCEELRTRANLIEGQSLVDGPFYRGRVTWLVGMVSAFALWRRFSDPAAKAEDWFLAFIRSHHGDLWLWGEAAIPQFLAMIWYVRQATATPESDRMLAELIKAVCSARGNKQVKGLADPYHGFGEVMEEMINPSDAENYEGPSYTLETLVHLFARRGWRQELRFLWPRITYLNYAEFRVQTTWESCLWRSEHGDLVVSQPGRRQSWSALIKEAKTANKMAIPKLYRQYPELLLVFVLAYPHRFTKDIAKYLDDCL